MVGRTALGAVLVCVALAACSSHRPAPGDQSDQNLSEADQNAAEAGTSDPLQGFNRAMQSFNDTADRWVLKPVAKGYRAVVPSPLRRGISDFYSNLSYPLVAVNQFLQGKPGLGFSDIGRFVMNSTLGILGFFDPATDAGLKAHDEDFGQTFGKWGIASGPYLVLPLLGPSDFRDGTGSLLNLWANPVRYMTDEERLRYGLIALNAIQVRASLLDAEQLISGDRYIFMRDAYLQRREYLIKDGQVEDEFMEDDSEE
jgi:phospholipid-binding lipoprotein MlaA